MVVYQVVLIKRICQYNNFIDKKYTPHPHWLWQGINGQLIGTP